MTVHASKGLEFPVVFITGMEERLFPLSTYEQDELEEERRLFYVAMTRAQEKIFLSWARSRYQYGQPQQCLRSMFVTEIDASIVRCFPFEVRQREPLLPEARLQEGFSRGCRLRRTVFRRPARRANRHRKGSGRALWFTMHCLARA